MERYRAAHTQRAVLEGPLKQITLPALYQLENRSVDVENRESGGKGETGIVVPPLDNLQNQFDILKVKNNSNLIKNQIDKKERRWFTS